MLRSASELRAAARKSLSGKWSGAVLVVLVYWAIMGAVPVWLEQAGALGLSNLWWWAGLPVLLYGLAVAFLDNIRSGGRYTVEQLFVGFKEYWRVWGTAVLMYVYVALWSLLLIVPGIIKSFSYAMTFYVMRDEPGLKFNAAIERSMAMMRGHKFDLFYLWLTFIGWWLLCILTLGIGYLWLVPYMQAATAHFYEDVKAEYEERQRAAC